jgi:Asp/Glu/hydantoin racemase
MLTASRDAHKRAENMIGEQFKQIDRLRADLATVTAERDRQMTRGDDYYSEWQAERAALAETRKALEQAKSELVIAWEDDPALESARAELAKADARVKELEAEFEEAGWNAMGEDL